jgi:hypothetical protein
MSLTTTQSPKPEAPSAPQKPSASKPLEHSRFKTLNSSESSMGNRHAAVLSTGTPFAAVLEPSFWVNHAATKLKPGDTIEIHSDDRRMFGRCYVVDVVGNHAHIEQLEFHEFGARTFQSQTQEYRVQYLGPHLLWGVIRLKDEVAVKQGLESKSDAETSLRGIERSLDRKIA